MFFIGVLLIIVSVAVQMVALTKSENNGLTESICWLAACACVFGVAILSGLTNTDTSALIVT